MKKNKLKYLRIFGIIFLLIGITLVVLAFSALKNEYSPNPLLLILGFLLVGLSIFMIISSCSSSILKMQFGIVKDFQESLKNDLKEFSNTSAEIRSEAIEKTLRSIKKGLNDQMYCKHCGVQIDTDSTFCKKCGKKQ